MFDLATCHSSSPRLVDKSEALNSLARVLRPSGHPLIPHGLSREKVIAIHSGGRTPIQNDLLPPGEQSGRMLVRAGFGDVSLGECDEPYVVVGRRISAMNADGEISRHRIDNSLAPWYNFQGE